MLERILREPVVPEFAFDLISGPAGAPAQRAAALDHEAGDDPVKDQAVVKALADQIFEVFHRVRRVFRQQLQFDPAAVFHFDDYHMFLLDLLYFSFS